MVGNNVTRESAGHPVAIRLVTYIIQGGDVSNFDFDLTGRLFQMGHIIYLRFMEDDHHDGHPVPVTVRIDGQGQVRLTRLGSNPIRLNFVQNRQTTADYRTPYGSLVMQTVTPELVIRYQNQPLSGSLKINYDLYSQRQLLGHYRLRLSFTV